MSTIINFKCTNCDFEFQDQDLIFYVDELNQLQIESLTMENSKKMIKSPLSGYLYENYCSNCKNLIKTFVPETKANSFSNEEIKEKLINFIENIDEIKDNTKNIKILIFDFENTFYKKRRAILEDNNCPNCNEKMSLVISKKIPCPKCGERIEEIYE